MLDAIAAHIEFIHGNHIFGKIVADSIIDTKFTVNGIFRCQKIGHLNIQLLIPFFTNKINFPFRGFPNSDSTPAEAVP